MERTHDGRHGQDCFACRIGPGPMIAPSATPTRTPSKPTGDRDLGNSWERGIATDERGLPINGETGPLGVKQLANDRTRIEKRLAEVRDPAYWAAQASESPAA